MTIAAIAAALVPSGSVALAGVGQPSPWQIGLQESASVVMDQLIGFHTFLLVIITLITILVLALLLIVMVRFNAKANPTPSRTTHNTFIEVVWTVLPIVILGVIVVPSFKLLFLELDIPPADLTVKATGQQWSWSYSYPDNGNLEFPSLLARDKQPRLLAVDHEMVVPVNKVVRVQVIGADVIHSFAVPSFGIKIDAVPGRLNETWFKAEHEGMYYGQCSELCGRDHAFMPIAVKVVSDSEFTAWVEDMKKQGFARGNEASPTAFAAVDATGIR
ncbi:MAG: cytochrome c oxidase subunit II [Xanthobacteraceae bacterium]